MESENHGGSSNKTDRDVIRDLHAVSSLEHMSTVKIATTMCQQGDVKELVLDHIVLNKIGSFKGKGEELISALLEKKVNDLPIYEFFIPQISLAVKQIKSEYFYFCQNIIHYQSDKVLRSSKNYVRNVIDSCCWTCEGKVNLKNSVHCILRNEAKKKKNLQALFELACKFWLEEDVKFIWMKLPQRSKDELISKRGKNYCFLHYWLCNIHKQEKKFSDYIKNKKWDIFQSGFHYMDSLDRKMNSCLDELRIHVNSYMFALAVFNGWQLGINYFYEKLDDLEKDCLIKVAKVYFDKKYISGETAFWLLMKLNSEDRKAILLSHCSLIIETAIRSWWYRKYTLDLIETNEHYLDEKMYYNILKCLLQYVEIDKNAFVVLKKVWLIIPVTKKQAFCNFIVEHREYLDSYDTFWEKITPDIFNWFLQVDSIKEIFLSKILDVSFEILRHKRYDIVNLVLEKCCGTKGFIIKKIILMEKSTQIITSWYAIEEVNKCLNWALESEDCMNENAILKFIKELLQEPELTYCICRAIKEKKWNEIITFTNHFVSNNRNANGLQNDLNLMKKNILTQLFGDKDEYEILFRRSDVITTWNEKTFGKHFIAFLSSGTSDEQVNNIMKEIKFGDNVWSMCSQWIRHYNWKSLNNFVNWCSQYGKVTWDFKNEIFKKFLLDAAIKSSTSFWRKSENYENVNKFLYSGCQKNAKNKSKVWTFKKENIGYLASITFDCVKNLQRDELKIFLPWIFEEGTTDNEYSTVVSLFKLNVVKMIIEEKCRIWEENPSSVKLIINWDKENAGEKKKIYDVKKYFAENYQPALEEKKIKALIMKL